ncbi:MULTISPECIES: ferrochelatase [Caldilinea]|jgi:ferrochelatase|uniref:Ferrochelatase n=1 Tax=Caldilinea aerophila (strain DSM 14535 / JCM 11387 / NBRC 104270 / STL-6-O1) TaxID=926550 RepID=I0I3W0_CALAS|nr:MULTISPECIES: ferrochelatase [Caldilinea]MBO9392583.1 ferrochelatase [Caldilinea sp.]BAL99947.1 ferrochelatase [Caldilinea aerophila DSM 14535 = NBRC 104270]GIV73383.1 MAG: ferrochelatase [Caldilinea sp.]
MKTAVLLLAYGGPNSLADIPAYLLDIRGGRATPQALIDEITHRYEAIGGASPLLRITQSAATKLQERIGLPVYVGMRHWAPWIKDTVAQMVADGVQQAVVICMAPHYSSLSIGAYRRRLDEALAQVERPFAVRFVESWHTQPEYIDAVAANVRVALGRFAPEERNNAFVVFTAHSLPASILERGEPYDRQLRETASLLAQRLNLPADRWDFSYQSAANTGVPWLGPQIEEFIVELAQRGEKNVVVAPIGFVADHVEVLYDIDIGVREIAHRHGVRIERPPMLNDSPAMVRILAALVEEALQATPQATL